MMHGAQVGPVFYAVTANDRSAPFAKATTNPAQSCPSIPTGRRSATSPNRPFMFAAEKFPNESAVMNGADGYGCFGIIAPQPTFTDFAKSASQAVPEAPSWRSMSAAAAIGASVARRISSRSKRSGLC